MDRPGEPTIRECVPTAGPVGSKVVIHGANFGKEASGRVVSFNSVVATEVDANAAGGVPRDQEKTRFRGTEDQKNLQSRQAPEGAVADSENKTTAADKGAATGAAAGAAASKSGDLGKREVDQQKAADSAAATRGPAATSAAKQPGDVAAQTQGVAGDGSTNFPPVERGEAEHGVSGAAATAVVTHRAPDPSTEETITVTVPEGATPGDIVVTVNGIASNGSRFTVTAV